MARRLTHSERSDQFWSRMGTNEYKCECGGIATPIYCSWNRVLMDDGTAEYYPQCVGCHRRIFEPEEEIVDRRHNEPIPSRDAWKQIQLRAYMCPCGELTTLNTGGRATVQSLQDGVIYYRPLCSCGRTGNGFFHTVPIPPERLLEERRDAEIRRQARQAKREDIPD